MTTRSVAGIGLFYTRDSEGRSEHAPPGYVSWALREAVQHGVTLNGTPKAMEEMIRCELHRSGDLYLDYGISGNHLQRPGLDALRARALSDRQVSHIFIPRRDRLARPDQPTAAMEIEMQLRSAGLTIVFMNSVVGPLKNGARVEMADLLMMAIDYHVSGEFRRELAEKLITAKIRLAELGFSIGGEPPYGGQRWLCSADGTPKRALLPREYVKMPGHHVVWLPDDTKLKVVHRILDLVETMPVKRVARILNEEGIPSPNAGRTYKRNGVTLETSGLWTGNTIKHIVSHPFLLGLMEYGKRSSGDQMRFTPTNPRQLEDADFTEAGKLKTVINPTEQRRQTPIPGIPSVVADQEQLARVKAILDERGRHLKGKPRAKNNAVNPLGGRIYDMNCGWPMYRYHRRKKFCYTCALYQNSEAQCCHHNTVNGEQSTRLVVSAIQQYCGRPEQLNKLREKLGELARQEVGQNPHAEKRTTLENELRKLNKNLDTAGRNMTFADNDEIREVMFRNYNELKAQRDRLQAELANLPEQAPPYNAEQAVEAALAGLTQLADSAKAEASTTELIRAANAKLFLRFEERWQGKRKFNVLPGGILTLGAAPPPIPLYEGPTDRVIIKKMIKEGVPVSPVLRSGSSEQSDPDPNSEWSAKVKRVTRRCT